MASKAKLNTPKQQNKVQAGCRRVSGPMYIMIRRKRSTSMPQLVTYRFALLTISSYGEASAYMTNPFTDYFVSEHFVKVKDDTCSTLRYKG